MIDNETFAISFAASKEDHKLIGKCARRAIAESDQVRTYLSYQTLVMDLSATHANGCPMNFEKLLNAPPFDFLHDIIGIANHIDRSTGKLTKCFVPRCAQ